MINKDSKLSVKKIKFKALELLKVYHKYNISDKLLISNAQKSLIKVKQNCFILDLIQLAKQIIIAEKILYIFAKNKKKILLIDNKNQNPNHSNLSTNIKSDITKNFFYMKSKWTGGFITNWDIFKNKLNKLDLLRENNNKLVKKEKLQNLKNIKKLEKAFSGIENLNSLPDIVILTSLEQNKLAAQECKKLGIIVIALLNKEINSNLFDIGIIDKLNSIKSKNYLVSLLLKQIYLAYKI